MKILVANVGSTSFKHKLIETDTGEALAKGGVERVGNPPSRLTHSVPSKGVEVEMEVDAPDHNAAIKACLDLLTDPEKGAIKSLDEIDGVGFKAVFAKGITRSALVTEEVVRAMEEYSPAVPVHNPAYIAAMRAFQELTPKKPLVAVFETWFHETMPDYAYVYGVPYDWLERHGIRRYGFHGASHRYISERVPQILGVNPSELRLVSCHLGGSSSLCAIKGGKSVDTSMGFSAQAGVMQGTRCGDFDAFALLYVMEKENLSVEEMRRLLSKESGLKGVSGIGADMRDILKAMEEGNERARLAFQAFCYEVKKFIGAYAAAMGGLDAVAFTGGMGEKSPQVRAEVCKGLEFLGLELDPERNEKTIGEEGIISANTSKVKVLVVPTNEELIVARETARVIREARGEGVIK